MFGRDWEKAEATVVAVKDLTNWTGDPDSDFTQSRPHEYVVDVRPEGQPPFRATFRDPRVRGYMDHPSEGQIINVLCRPKSGEAKLIADEWKKSSGKSKGEKQAEEERFDAAKHGSPGEPAAPETSAADQLTKLGERHERGELTDAEYETEMAKVWDRESGLPG
jgi:hypothetical protein